MRRTPHLMTDAERASLPVTLTLAAARLGASPAAMGLVLTSPPVLHSLLNGNLEWLCLLGVVLPPGWGVWWVVVKPQVAGGVAVFWAVEAWRDGGWRAVTRLVGPVVAALVGSFFLYGFWPWQARHTPGLWWNASLWRFGPAAARAPRPVRAQGGHSLTGSSVADVGPRGDSLIRWP